MIRAAHDFPPTLDHLDFIENVLVEYRSFDKSNRRSQEEADPLVSYNPAVRHRSPFNNHFRNSKKAGIYADLVSCEPLFSLKINCRPPQNRED